MSQLRYDGQVAVVTGAGNGLGRSHALFLGSRGAHVVVNDLGGAVDGTGGSRSAAQGVVDEIKAAGGEATADFNSVATFEGASRVIDTAMQAYGRIDILVNNAGILRDKSFINMEPEAFQAVVDVHLMGTAWMCMAVWPTLYREQQYGRIINTTSAASFGNFGQANYSAAKAGIVGLSKTLAHEGAKKNIKVNILAPMARTRMTESLMGPRTESLDPALVTPVVGYLAHNDCATTGEIYSAGGGRVARIFWGATPGIYNQQLTAEDVRDQLDGILDVKDFVVARSPADEMKLMAKVRK